MNRLPKKAANAKVGFCNICNTHGPLTWDHVPPKGSIRISPVETKNFLNWMRTEMAARGVDSHGFPAEIREMRTTLSQNGLKFRSICAVCNNERLGARYDLELNRLSNSIRSLVRIHTSGLLAAPGQFDVTVRTHYLVRAIVGHLLAAHGSDDPSVPSARLAAEPYSKLRQYFMDESMPLPLGITIYCWPYFGRNQVVINSLGILAADKSSKSVIGDLIKFSPMAYFVTFSPGVPLDLAVPLIRGDGCNDMNCEVLLRISLHSVPDSSWPEDPGPGHHVIMPIEASRISVSIPPRHGSSKRGQRRRALEYLCMGSSNQYKIG